MGSAVGYDWLQISGNPQHYANNTQEVLITPSNVASLLFSFQVSLPSVEDGAPVYLQAVSTPLGVRDVLYVTTRAGHIVALDAHTGITIWSHQYAAGSCISSNGGTCYTTSSPAIDPTRQWVYSYGLDGRVHKFAVGDGTESFLGGWPQLTTLKGFNEKGSSALAWATASNGSSYLYVAHGGYPGDAGDYQGHITAINLATGAANVFNTLCSDQAVHFAQTPMTPDCAQKQSAVWARVAVVYDDVTDRIYMGTGNGLFDANAGGHNWADSVISVNPDGTGSGGKPLDSYTPGIFLALQQSDADLGSTAPAILPQSSFGGRLAVQAGKDSKLRMINLSNLSGSGGPGFLDGDLQTLNLPQGGVILSAPAVWINPADQSTWVFFANSSGISALKLTFPSGAPTLVLQWQRSLSGFSPLLANNVLYFAGSGAIRALDPVTGNTLWSDSRVGGIHWESPVVANGMLYVTDESNHLTAYSLRGPDFSGDNRSDLVWRNAVTGGSVLWYMNGATQTGGATLPTVPDTNWQIAGVADFNGDGRPDLLWHNGATGATVIWYMNGAAQIGGATLMTVPDTNWKIVATGDLNGDGKPDLVWRNSATGADVVWFLSSGVQIGGATLSTVPDPNWRIVGTGDFNGDGKTDLVWRNASTGSDVVWFYNGTAYLGGATLEVVPDTNWNIAAIADYNSDGKPDLVWRNGATGAEVVWYMDQTSHVSGGTLSSVADPNWRIVGPR